MYKTYLKKDDKSEINSLIRLMELTTPASFNSMNIPEAEKIERLQELELKDIKSSIMEMSRNQNQLLKEFSILKFNIKKENYRNINPWMNSMENLRNVEIKKRLYNIDEPAEIL